MTILSKAEIEQLFVGHWPHLIDDEVVDVHETLDALRVALEAWAYFWREGYSRSRYDMAVELTKPAGIDWREEVSK